MTRPTPPPQDLYADAVGIGINSSWLSQFLGRLEAMTKEGYWDSNQYHGTNQVERFMKFLCEGVLPPMIIGQIVMMPTESNIPTWLLPCDGQIVSAYDYPDLHNVIGETYHILESSNFYIPDLRNRVPVGAGGEYYVGQVGGAKEVILTVNQLPSHTHNTPVSNPSMTANSVIAPAGAMTGSGFGVLTAQTGTRWQVAQMSSAGDGQPHNNMQPYHAIGFYIVAKYP